MVLNRCSSSRRICWYSIQRHTKVYVPWSKFIVCGSWHPTIITYILTMGFTNGYNKSLHIYKYIYIHIYIYKCTYPYKPIDDHPPIYERIVHLLTMPDLKNTFEKHQVLTLEDILQKDIARGQHPENPQRLTRLADMCTGAKRCFGSSVSLGL